jgi:cell division protein FtsB
MIHEKNPTASKALRDLHYKYRDMIVLATRNALEFCKDEEIVFS